MREFYDNIKTLAKKYQQTKKPAKDKDGTTMTTRKSRQDIVRA
jgi:hypothetical protein